MAKAGKQFGKVKPQAAITEHRGGSPTEAEHTVHVAVQISDRLAAITKEVKGVVNEIMVEEARKRQGDFFAPLPDKSDGEGPGLGVISRKETG